MTSHMNSRRTTPACPAIVMTALALTWCTGCPQMAITTAATTAASAVVDDRSLAQQGSDLDVKARIEQQLLAQAPDLASHVNVDVYLGRVMLTGVVSRRSKRRTAVRLASDAAPDHELFDDIEVAQGDGFADLAGDFAVNKELGVNLLAAEGIASQSFQHRVVNGTAFIMGEARSASQVETARQVALQTPGVQRVVTHIVVEP
jgi:osmotically-inducible protein OsmY